MVKTVSKEEKQKNSLFKRILSWLWSKKKLLALILILTLAISGYRWYKLRNGDFDTVQVEKGTVAEELILTGEIDADEYAALTFPTSGKVSWVGVAEGDEVYKGQGLTQIDTTVLNAAYQQAQATYRAAQATVEYVHDQVKDNDEDESFAEKDTRTTAEVAKDRAWDALLAAQYNLDNAMLRAPFAGIVTYVAQPFSGVSIVYTQTQVELINPQTIYFDVSADQSEVGDIYLGQKVIVVLDSMPDETIEGEAEFIGFTPKVGESGTVYKVKVKLAKENLDVNLYRMGMTGDAKFILREKEDVLYVPPGFVNSDTGGKYVNKNASNGKTYIEVGLESEDRVEIMGDVAEGDTIYD